MQNNQNNQQSGGQKPQQSLSWSQAASAQADAKKAVPGQTTAATARTGTSNSRMALIFAIGLVVGWLITWSWFDLRSGKDADLSMTATSTEQSDGSSAITETQSGTQAGALDQNGTSSQTPSAPKASSASTDTITVASPQEAGTSVAISNLNASDSVWVAVYEDNDGKVGRMLGAAHFHQGQTSGTVSLLRSTLPNLTYYVGLLADTPAHTFDIHTNEPLLGANGQQIMVQFTAR